MKIKFFVSAALFFVLLLIFAAPVFGLEIGVVEKSNITIDVLENNEKKEFHIFEKITDMLDKKENIFITVDAETMPEQNKELLASSAFYDKTEDNTEKKVLIYHTHTNEAYTPLFEGEYPAYTAYMTADNKYNVNAVGSVIAENIGKYGVGVVHDMRNNIAEVYSHSYENSLETMKENKAKHSSIEVYIDVHRDSVDDREFAQNDIAVYDGREYARVLFVVGRGDEYNGEEKPDWEKNSAFAQTVSDALDKRIPGISKGLMLKKGRYNQHLSEKSLLIEVGYDANTLIQAINTAQVIGEVLGEILK